MNTLDKIKQSERGIPVGTPISDAVISGLSAGDALLLSGYIYTGCDSLYSRFNHTRRIRWNC